MAEMPARIALPVSLTIGTTTVVTTEVYIPASTGASPEGLLIDLSTEAIPREVAKVLESVLIAWQATLTSAPRHRVEDEDELQGP